jgi:hypothetical protein
MDSCLAARRTVARHAPGTAELDFKAFAARCHDPHGTDMSDPTLASRAQFISIQAVLGLPMGDLARVLGLSRAELYKWIDDSADLQLQEGFRRRLSAVQRIAGRWRERSGAPFVSVVHEPLAAGRPAFSMLVADVIDEAAIVGAFDELLIRLNERPRSRNQRLADAGFTRRPSARALPADE